MTKLSLIDRMYRWYLVESEWLYGRTSSICILIVSELERLSGQTFSINIIIRFKIVNEVQMALWPIFTSIYTTYTLAKLWLSYD